MPGSAFSNRYNEFRYQQGLDKASLGGTVGFKGPQVYGSFLF